METAGNHLVPVQENTEN